MVSRYQIVSGKNISTSNITRLMAPKSLFHYGEKISWFFKVKLNLRIVGIWKMDLINQIIIGNIYGWITKVDLKVIQKLFVF